MYEILIMKVIRNFKPARQKCTVLERNTSSSLPHAGTGVDFYPTNVLLMII